MCKFLGRKLHFSGPKNALSLLGVGPSYTTQTLQAAGLTPSYSHFTLLLSQMTDDSYVGKG